MKKISAFLLAVLMLMSLFSCSRPKEHQESETPPESRIEESEIKGTLKILSERFCWGWDVDTVHYNHFSSPRDNIANILFYFREIYPDVKIDIEYLPTKQEEREFYIKNRRISMMSGKEVPDIYLMPTLSIAEISYYPMEPLFKDVAQTMRNGWFADISGLYNGDTELHTEELNKPVMDAGTVGSARYVLPLGYEMPVYITRRDLVDKAGLDWERLNSGVDSMIDAFLELNEQGDSRWAANAFFTDNLPLSLLPNPCDYDTEEALIEGKQVEELLSDFAECTKITAAEWKKRQDAGEGISGRGFSLLTYLDTGNKSHKFAIDEDSPGAKASMSKIISVAGIGKAMDKEIMILPMRAADGTLNAEITYWGAISAGCENKKLAYEFLRLFLTPEVQHEGQLKTSAKTYEMNFKLSKDNTDAGLFPGWPVRYKGFADKRWGRMLNGIENTSGYDQKRKEAILQVTIDDNDLPILDAPIDNARFTSSLDQEFYTFIRPLENFIDVNKYTQADAVKAGNEFVRNLKYHLAEG